MWTSAPRYSTWSPSGQIVFATVDSGSRLSRPCSNVDRLEVLRAEDLARVGLLGAEQDPEERRLAAPVRPEEADPAVRRHEEVEVREEDVLSVRLADALRLDEPLRVLPGLLEVEADALRPVPLRELPDLGFERARSLDARLLLRRARLGAPEEPLRLAPQLVPQRQLALRVGREALLLHRQVRRVVAADVEEAVHVPPVELEDPVRDALQEHPVVRHRDRRVRRPGEQLLEPEDRVDVEMVRGLVEEEEIGLPHELARERDALLPPAGERRDGRPGRAALRHEREPRNVLVGREPGLPVLLAGVRARGALEHRLADRRALAEDRHLREIADAQAPLRGPRALVRRDLAREDREQRRLPGAVRADQADAVARVDGTRDPLEQGV